jgi:hypothetical protein
MGKGSMRQGIEKKVPKEATAHPAAITSARSGTGVDGPAAGNGAPPAAKPNSRPKQIMSTMMPA